MKRKAALITGITGQDGSYLSEMLLAKGYSVHGLVRQIEVDDPAWQQRIAPVRDRIELHGADLLSFDAVTAVVERVAPDECYHLGAVSFVSYNHADEAATLTANIGGAQTLFASLHSSAPSCRVFFAASSEIFGNAKDSPQSESTPVEPRSVYGISKAAGYFLAQYYRSKHGMYACSGILYNHESPRRGPEFVTRKISQAAARIASGDRTKLQLGDLEAVRDWGHATDFVRAMWLMLQQSAAEDFVIATGQTHSVRQFCDVAFRRVGLDYRDWVATNPEFVRPPEAVTLSGNPARAGSRLGWRPTVSFDEIVGEMVDRDCELAGVGNIRRQIA